MNHNRRGAGAFTPKNGTEDDVESGPKSKETPPTLKDGAKYCLRETEKRLQRKRLCMDDSGWSETQSVCIGMSLE